MPPPNRSDNKEKALARPAASRVVWLVGLVSCPNRKGSVCSQVVFLQSLVDCSGISKGLFNVLGLDITP